MPALPAVVPLPPPGPDTPPSSPALALVPPWAVKLAVVLGAVLVPLAVLLPYPYGPAAGIGALVCAFLACLPLPALTFTQPLIPLTLVPGALAVGGALQLAAASIPSPLAHGALLLAAQVCWALAGKVLTPPVRALAPPAE